MKHHAIPLLLILAVLLGIASFTLAQDEDTCPNLVTDAIGTIADLCDDTGRNQACYGNLSLETEPQQGVTDLVFASPGDIADVGKIRVLRLSEMDVAVPEWGVALMRLQANLPDTFPGQGVTVLLFGNVELTNAVDPEPPTLPMTATAGVNVRLRPVDGEVMKSLAYGEEVLATGRLADSSWIRIAVPEDNRGSGWVSASFLTTDGDPNALAVMEPGAPIYGPMQAFYFRSGIGDSQCREAPESGILIQTPGGAGRIELVINEVNIQLGSTAFLQAEPADVMTVNVLEGSAQVAAQGDTQYVPAGTRVTVPLDAAGVAVGAPSEPEPYEDARMAALPMQVLPQETEVTPALTETEIEEALSAPAPGRVILRNPSGSTVTMYTDSHVASCGGMASILGTVPNDTGATILAGPVNPCYPSPGGEYYQVQTDTGVVGWVLARYIVPS